MNNELFERLLYEEEGPTLDFKRDQYSFSRATDEEKSELLKDILGFVNSWRRGDAYILIGIQDVRGDRSEVVGVAEHLDDHALQQFVNNLTDQPVRFQYEAFSYEDKKVGVIRIEEQARPVCLKRDYGKLKGEKVYVRRGSSTDPSKPAHPREIARMGAGLEQQADLVVAFARSERAEAIGAHLGMEPEYCEMPDETDIPELRTLRDRDRFAYIQDVQDNSFYYRQLAKYEFERRLFNPIRFAIRNQGRVSASSVRVELAVSPEVMLRSRLEPRPKRTWYKYDTPDMPVYRDQPGDVSWEEDDDGFRMQIECGNIQPGRVIWSEAFYLARSTTGEIVFTGRIFADNLDRPKDFDLRIACIVKQTKMSVGELVLLPDPE